MIYILGTQQIRPTHKIEFAPGFKRSVESLRLDPEYGVQWLHNHDIKCVDGQRPATRPDEFTEVTYVLERKIDGYYRWAEVERVVDEDAKEAAKTEAARVARISEILTELQSLDLSSVRPLRALQANPESEPDLIRLTDYENRAEELRLELAGLNLPQGEI